MTRRSFCAVSPLAHPPLILNPAEWDSVREAIETGAEHPLDALLDACHVIVDTCRSVPVAPQPT